MSIYQAKRIISSSYKKYILFSNLNLFPSSTRINSFINKVMNTRNYLTHYDESLKSKTTSENTLREITDKLNLILFFWILNILGLDKNYSKNALSRYWKYEKLFEKDLKD